MPVYSYEQLLEISKSELVHTPKFLYEDLAQEVAKEVAEAPQDTPAPAPVSHAAVDAEPAQESRPLVVGDDESDLTFLAQRYLERGTAKTKKDATSVSSKLVVTQLNSGSSSASSGPKGSHIPVTAAAPVTETTDEAGDDGWISVGPKHQPHHRNNHGGRKSFGQYDRNARRSHGRGPRPDTGSWRNNGSAPSKPPGLSGAAAASSSAVEDHSDAE